MAEILIREAEIDDIEAVSDLFQKLANFIVIREGRTEFSPKAQNIYYDYLLHSLGKETHSVLVAEANGELVGFVEGKITEPHPLLFQERYGHIYHLYVRKAWRQYGTGGKLCEAFEAWVREHGLDHVELSVRVKNFMGRGFWHRMGYAEYALIMTKDLGEE